MSRFSSEERDLVDDVLRDDQIDGVRTSSLERAIGELGRRRRRRLFWRGTMALTPLAIVFFVLASTRTPSPPAQTRSTTIHPPTDAGAPEKKDSTTIRYLTDDELLKLFPDRAVALIDVAEGQRLVFLDEHRHRPVNATP